MSTYVKIKQMRGSGQENERAKNKNRERKQDKQKQRKHVQLHPFGTRNTAEFYFSL